MTEPLVFVGIPTRNRAASLRESVKNVLAQDYGNLEILISDNCSDDDTEQVCRELMDADRRVRYVRQPRNIGLHGNHNFCMDASHGEFLCLFHDHDRRAPTVISEYVGFFQAHPRVGIVCADWDLIDNSDAFLGARDWHGPTVMSGLDYISRTTRAGRSSIATPGAMVRTEALGSTRFGLEAPIGFGDFPVWFRVAEAWDVGHIPRRLWSWRQNSVQHSARPIQSIVPDFATNLLGYCDGHLARWPQHRTLVNQWRTNIRRYLFWALAYEVGLHFRGAGGAVGERTLFEMMDYRLTPQQFEETLAQMKQYRTGAAEHLAFAAVAALIHLRVTSPLGWVIRHQATVRTLLGLR